MDQQPIPKNVCVSPRILPHSIHTSSTRCSDVKLRAFCCCLPSPHRRYSLESQAVIMMLDPCKTPGPGVCTPGPGGHDAASSHTLPPPPGSAPPVPAPDLLMQIKQEGELQLQEQQALGVEAWAAGQPDIGEEPWGLSQLDSGAGDISTDATSGECLTGAGRHREGSRQHGQSCWDQFRGHPSWRWEWDQRSPWGPSKPCNIVPVHYSGRRHVLPAPQHWAVRSADTSSSGGAV